MTPSMELRDIFQRDTPPFPGLCINSILWVLEAFLQDGGRVLCLRNPATSDVDGVANWWSMGRWAAEGA